MIEKELINPDLSSWYRYLLLSDSLFQLGMAGDLGEGASASPPGARKPAILLLREVHRAHHPAKSARISPSPSRITSPRRIGPKEGGLRGRWSFEGAAGTSSHPRSFRGWRQFFQKCCPGPVARGAGTGRSRMGGGGQMRWVGAKVARCGEGSIRRAFAFPESVIVCRFFYKDWTTII